MISPLPHLPKGPKACGPQGFGGFFVSSSLPPFSSSSPTFPFYFFKTPYIHYFYLFERHSDTHTHTQVFHVLVHSSNGLNG